MSNGRDLRTKLIEFLLTNNMKSDACLYFDYLIPLNVTSWLSMIKLNSFFV